MLTTDNHSGQTFIKATSVQRLYIHEAIIVSTGYIANNAINSIMKLSVRLYTCAYIVDGVYNILIDIEDLYKMCNLLKNCKMDIKNIYGNDGLDSSYKFKLLRDLHTIEMGLVALVDNTEILKKLEY